MSNYGLIRSCSFRFSNRDLFHEHLRSATKRSSSEANGTRPRKRHHNWRVSLAEARLNCGARGPVYETILPVNTPIISKVSLSCAPICGVIDSSAPEACKTRSWNRRYKPQCFRSCGATRLRRCSSEKRRPTGFVALRFLKDFYVGKRPLQLKVNWTALQFLASQIRLLSTHS
jgi:hypothetical protein